MARSQSHHDELLTALDAALAGDWKRVHPIVQRLEGDPVANWLHGLLHKLEGEDENAHYWYDRAPMEYGRFSDPKVELRAIHHELTREV